MFQPQSIICPIRVYWEHQNHPVLLNFLLYLPVPPEVRYPLFVLLARITKLAHLHLFFKAIRGTRLNVLIPIPLIAHLRI